MEHKSKMDSGRKKKERKSSQSRKAPDISSIEQKGDYREKNIIKEVI